MTSQGPCQTPPPSASSSACVLSTRGVFAAEGSLGITKAWNANMSHICLSPQSHGYGKADFTKQKTLFKKKDMKAT